MLRSSSLLRVEPPHSPQWFRTIPAQPEIRIALFLTVAVFALGYMTDATNANEQLVAEQRQHLGGEYYNIARALVDGRGFSDPFGEPTGPTAWMPPLYPLILSVLLWLTHSRAMTADIVLTLSNLTYVAIGVTLYVVAVSRAQRLPALVVLLFYLIWLMVFRFWIFQLTHDIWIQALEVNIVLLLLHRKAQTGVVRTWQWGLLGGLLVLSSPALTFAFVCLASFMALRDKARRAWFAILIIMLAIGSPWTVRNAITFHRLIPVKSNLYFDAFQGNVVDADGVYDNETMAKHPFGSPRLRFQYGRLGESRFIDADRAQFFRLLAEKPGVYAMKVARRATAALVWYMSLGPSDKGVTLVAERICYSLPIAAFLSLMVFGGPNRTFATPCALFSLTLLSPYIFIAYYIRYALPLTPIFTLFVFLAVDRVLSRLSDDRKPAPVPDGFGVESVGE
jgi:hypothetical protein